MDGQTDRKATAIARSNRVRCALKTTKKHLARHLHDKLRWQHDCLSHPDCLGRRRPRQVVARSCSCRRQLLGWV